VFFWGLFSSCIPRRYTASHTPHDMSLLVSMCVAVLIGCNPTVCPFHRNTGPGCIIDYDFDKVKKKEEKKTRFEFAMGLRCGVF